MIYPMFSIRDVRTGFMSPTLDQNAQSAVRNFEHAVMQSSSLMNSHPKDYQLFKIADFDSETGKVTPCEIVEHIVDAVDFL